MSNTYYYEDVFFNNINNITLRLGFTNGFQIIQSCRLHHELHTFEVCYLELFPSEAHEFLCTRLRQYLVQHTALAWFV